MAISSISREPLDRFLPHRHNLGRFIGAEEEWGADPVGNTIGIIAKGTATRNWGYAVLRRDEAGGYHFWDLQTRMDNRESARLQIVHRMTATQPNGRNCSPLVG